MGINQKPLPAAVPPSMPGANDVDAEYTSYKKFNDAVIEGLLAPTRGRQVPRLSADAAEFQPTERHDPGPLPAAEFGDFHYQPGEPGTMPGARGDMSPTRIVGDLVTGMPRAGDAAQQIEVDLGADLATGGRPGPPPQGPRPPGQGLGEFYRNNPARPRRGGGGRCPPPPPR